MTRPAPPTDDIAYVAWMHKEVLGYRRIMKLMGWDHHRKVFEAASANASFQFDFEDFIKFDRVCSQEHGVTPFTDWVHDRVHRDTLSPALCVATETLNASADLGQVSHHVSKALCPDGENGSDWSPNERRIVETVAFKARMTLVRIAQAMRRETVR